MTDNQIIVFAILGVTFGMFIWGRWRYDVVAFGALIVGLLSGVVPTDEAFSGFGHPAVATVAVVLIISRALTNSGVIDLLTENLVPSSKSPTLQIGAMGGVAGPLSAFMNNVGALALMMPVAIRSATKRGLSPAVLLMPLSFASILGGLATLIGTPPNIIVASYRGTVTGTSFSMFDFTPVGAVTAVVGIVFVSLLGWRLIPRERLKHKTEQVLFDIEGYVAEARIPKKSELIGKTIAELDAMVDGSEAEFVGLIRQGDRISLARRRRLDGGDILIIEASPDALGKVISALGLELIAGDKDVTEDLKSDEVMLTEAVIAPNSALVGRTMQRFRLRARYRVNILAVSRQGRPHRQQLKSFRFQAGDVLLMHGDKERLPAVMNTIGLLPLAERDLRLVDTGKAGIAGVSFALAILAAAMGVVSAPVALAAAVLVMVVGSVVTPREAYEAIDWPVIVLLGALIPIGEALESTGGTRLVADGLLAVASGLPEYVLLALVLVVTMTLSDIVNNAATAVIMAPIGVGIAQTLGASADPFLMAVAVGASCAFLTPIGHQNNTLVMGPGGYRFGDYWRMGLPLEVIIVAVSIPLITIFWPL